MSFYKSANDIVPTAWNEFKKSSDILLKEMQEFAAHFDAEPAIGFSVTGHRFHGFLLNNYETREDKELWRIPRKQNQMISNIRASVKDKILKPRLEVLQEKYSTLKPNLYQTCTDDLLTAMGTDWGNLLFSGIAWKMRNNIFYVETSVKLNENMTEILGSEYREAMTEKEVSHA